MRGSHPSINYMQVPAVQAKPKQASFFSRLGGVIVFFSFVGPSCKRKEISFFSLISLPCIRHPERGGGGGWDCATVGTDTKSDTPGGGVTLNTLRTENRSVSLFPTGTEPRTTLCAMIYQNKSTNGNGYGVISLPVHGPLTPSLRPMTGIDQPPIPSHARWGVCWL